MQLHLCFVHSQMARPMYTGNKHRSVYRFLCTHTICYDCPSLIENDMVLQCLTHFHSTKFHSTVSMMLNVCGWLDKLSDSVAYRGGCGGFKTPSEIPKF